VGGTDPAGGTGGGTGTCCPTGDCLCHGPAPTGLTSAAGPFSVTTYTISTGTVHYPTNADAPFAAVAIVGGFTNTGPEMAPWGRFYASHGIVTAVTTTTGVDSPDIRATKLLAAITELKAENTKSGSPLFGKLAGRYGTSGYSMGGGGTTIASTRDATLKTSVGLASWSPVGNGIQVPTLLLCGSSDGTAPCSMSQGSYNAIPSTTPKMMTTISGASHLNWFGPTNAGGGISGETALAFQKVFLEGDERWRPFLLQSRGTKTTNIQ
jgi:pimeloyl-ACP methyl ester carboxylesterase